MAPDLPNLLTGAEEIVRDTQLVMLLFVGIHLGPGLAAPVAKKKSLDSGKFCFYDAVVTTEL